MSDFPTKSQEYPSSLASKVLDIMSMYFLALPVESQATKISRDISRNRGFVEGALPVLCALNIMTFANEKSFEEDINLYDVDPDDGFIKLKVSQKTQKRNRQKPRATINTSLFVKLGVTVPHTSEAATSLTITILAELKEILSFYFSLLRRTELAGDIKALLFSNARESARDVSPEVSSTEVVESPAQRPSAYPMVQPMKAALYFDNADGFGEWRILISTEGYRNLREYRRADEKIFKIIVKKIKQLSNGHFSDDNQKRLNGPDAGIPIHEAKMTRDLRLVYQVDCVPDHDGESERQDPWLVFSELMGIIKGSEYALSCSGGVLDRPNYLRLPHRSNPNFANQREILYDIFEIYTKIKRQRRHHDVADRTQAIIKVLRSQSFPGQQIDYLYVDEAQDNLLIDALILRRLCKNPDGLFWAGDTAQTISAGSSFRFDDLKAFMYRMEQQHIPVNSARASLHQPTMFQLAINYRSHGGIVNCAHSVIELITRFWPNTIDKLQPEKGVVDGLKPVFFTGWDNDTVSYEQFLFGASHIEFGAQQCILVRDEAARQKLREQVGDIGLIMTLYESKGLEFNDVLLYNFFEDSVIDLSRWRIVLNGVEGERHAPNFERDEARYAGVCSELKLLYVGITRARKNMWIVDKSDKSDPMLV
ncbi:hypothetical protein AZE42_12316, partial [Rhizopogon vesiculosus]